ncbi:MAG: hypothetical protein KJ592_01815 [Nanoarchaeota archaeon]|nr:hypothetical protein [Nanoarchaeota archaeon]
MSKNKFKLGNAETVAMTVVVLLLILFAYNSIRIMGISNGASILPLVGASEIIPTGVPKIYGSELGIRYDDVSASTPQKADATIGVMSNIDRTVTLQGADLQRYINILSDISCEYCCGAASVIFEDGKSACGCAHSFAMRGLAKYLITEHGDDFSDDEILTEVAKWKVLFFPGIHETKAAVMKSQGIDTNYINLASNAYRGIEKGEQASGGMVGGC